MRHLGNETLSVHALRLDPSLQMCLGTNNPQIRRLFKILLVRNYRENALKLIWGLLKHVWILSCARHSHWPPVRGAQAAFLYFDIGHQNVIFSRTMHLIRIKFGVRHHGNEALSCCAPLLDLPPEKRLGNNFTSKSGIFLKKSSRQNLHGRTRWNYYRGFWGISRWKIMLGMANGLRSGGLRGRPLFWQ